MKVYVQVVNTRSCIFQAGVIEEPAKKGFEIANAIGHFGVNINSVEWSSNFVNQDLKNTPRLMTGIVTGTDVIVNVVAIQVVSDQPLE